MPIFQITAYEQYTRYQKTIYQVDANDAKEAKQKLIDGEDESLKHIESYDLDAENYEWIDFNDWKIEDITQKELKAKDGCWNCLFGNKIVDKDKYRCIPLFNELNTEVESKPDFKCRYYQKKGRI